MPRPKIEITDEQLEQIAEFAGFGLTSPQIAALLKMSERTLRAKKHEPKVSAAFKKGQAEAEKTIGQTIFNKAKKGDMTAAIWWEKTRAGRHEKVVQEHQGKSVEINIGRAAPQAEDKRESARRTTRGTGRLKAV